ncbi:MAG: tRNA (adenine(22)-N(1))-methyltransferase TrmK [Gemmatimonadales bacterium]
MTTELKNALPFELTAGQRRAIREITADMTSERRMHRLLMGEVGTGKTVVALFAMLLAVENGYQAVFMAPTELLVEQTLRRLPEDEEALAADLGTGSGAIAIALAARRPKARFVATDVSADALAVARENVARHGLSERIELRQGDWFAALRPGERFDVIASNPPYVATGDLAQATPEVRDHEPRLALHGGPEGLDALAVVVRGAADWLRPTSASS